MLSSDGSFKTFILCHCNFITCHVLVNGLCPVLKDYKVLTMVLKENFTRVFLVVTIFEKHYGILEEEPQSIFYKKGAGFW